MTLSEQDSAERKTGAIAKSVRAYGETLELGNTLPCLELQGPVTYIEALLFPNSFSEFTGNVE